MPQTLTSKFPFEETQTLLPPNKRRIDLSRIDSISTDSHVSRLLYVGYIISFSLVDIGALLRLVHDIPPWVHVMLTLIFSASAITCISIYLARATGASAEHRAILLHLVSAHNSRTLESFENQTPSVAVARARVVDVRNMHTRR